MPIFNMVGGGGGSSVLTGDAAVGEVLASKTFYSNDPASKLTGTMVNRGEVDTDITAVAQSVTIAQGYHNGSGTVQIGATDQSKLIAGNIKSGVTVLGVAGDSNVVDTSSGDAAVTDIATGKKAWVDGVERTGTMVDYTADYISMMDGAGDITALPSSLATLLAYGFYGRTNLKITAFPSGLASITTIPTYCFSGCSGLALTSIPSTVQTIEISAFSGCTNLALASLGTGITSIGADAFYGCANITLADGYVLSGITGQTKLRDSCFEGCSSIENISLPNYAGGMGYSQVFKDCTSLVTVQVGGIGKAVTSGVANIFQGCTQAGLTITLYVVPGTEPLTNSPWGATNATIVYCSSVDGSVL